jgi:RHS repeat-associated protein
MTQDTSPHTGPGSDSKQPLLIRIADDKLTPGQLISLRNSKLGHEVDTVDTGAAAVAAVQQRRCHLALMDIRLPELDGFEAIRRIRCGLAEVFRCGLGALAMRTFTLAAIALVLLTATALTARAEEGGVSVIADPSLANGDWPERVVLELPPAAGGTAPVVALAASHRTNQSEIGAGWHLQVGSTIRRRSMSNGVPELTGDLDESLFLADGVELVLVTDPLFDHYQPVDYDGSQFYYDADENVWTRRRNGWTWTYGGTTDTTRQIVSLPLIRPICDEPCNTEAWFLASVVDPFGNHIDYTYEVAEMPAGMAEIYEDYPSSKDHLVSTITYADGTAVVTFSYATRPDITVELSGGFPIVHYRRLTQIHSTAGGQLYTKYRFQYEDEYGNHSLLGTLTDCNNEQVDAPNEPTRRSLLRKLFRTSDDAMDPKTLIRCNRYHHQGIDWDDRVELNRDREVIPNPFVQGLDPIEDSWSPVGVEIDGDGRTDLVLLAYEGSADDTRHKVYISTPNRAEAFMGAGGGGDAGVYAAAWEAELNTTLHELVFADRIGRAIVDIDGDVIPEIVVESFDDETVVIRRAAPIGSSGGLVVNFSDVTNSLAACDLRFGEFADVDGDHLVDLVIRAHGANDNCPAVPETGWVKNLGASPWFDSAEKLPLWVPLERGGVAPGWEDALEVCENEAVAPPTDYNLEWTTEGYLADQARFADFNDDGVLDIAYALYGCWQDDEDNRWRPELDSVYSRIFWGTGRGTYVDSGLSAGPPVLLDQLDWGADETDNTRIAPGTLGAIDLDHDGRSELFQSSQSSLMKPGHFGYGWATSASVVPGDGGWGVSPSTLIGDSHHISMNYSAWPCDDNAMGTAWGDFDGDGFLDHIYVLGGQYEEEPGVPVDSWEVGINYSRRDASENRLIETDNEHGGRTRLTWGFSALLPNTNPELPINSEVIQTVDGPGGTRSITYHDGAMISDRVLPFGEVTVTNDRGGIEVYSFTITSWGGAKPQDLGVRYRENGSVEHVTVLFHGEYYPTSGMYVDIAPPYFNPLIRRCEYDVGFHAVDVAALEDDCRELAWLGPPVGQPGESPLDDSFPWNERTDDLLRGRRRVAQDDAERAVMARLWRGVGGRNGAPLASRMAGGVSINEVITSVLEHASPLLTSGDYYRWPVPSSLAGALPAVEAQEEAYRYPPIVSISAPDGYAWDYGYDHPAHKLVTSYEHRDLATLDDNRIVSFEWERPPPPAFGVLGDWWRLLTETTTDRFGNRLTQKIQSNFVGFDSPRLVQRCGRSTPADCATDEYKYFADGTLARHVFPDRTAESWTRLAWCGEPLTYTDAAGRVTTYTRDTRCLTQAMRHDGATMTFTHDTLLRPIQLIMSPGAGVNATATITRNYYYDDELTYQAEVVAREDWAYGEPRRAERRADGQLELIYTDGLGRVTKRVRCADTGSDADGGDIGEVACSANTQRTLAWNLYGADGNLKVATGPFEAGETPMTAGYGHDGQARPIVVMEPAHTPESASWRVDTILYSAGYEERTEPTATGTRVSRREHSTLGESFSVDGVARGSLTRGLLGEITSVTAADGTITLLDHDSRWQLAREIRVDVAGMPVRESNVMPDGSTQLRPYAHTIVARDARGRVLEEVLPDDTVLGYAYDNIGRLIRQDINGVTVRSYQYLAPNFFAMGRIRITDELGGSSVTSHVDGLGRVWLETAPRVANRSSFDTRGLLVSTTDINNLTTYYHYDIHDDLTHVVAPASGTTTFGRDGAGRVVTQTDADGVVDRYDYTYSGALYQHHRGPYLVLEQSYDPQGLVTAAIEAGVGTAMTFDNLGRLMERREGVEGASELRVTEYSYDAGDRVTEIRQTPVAGFQTATTQIHYDAWGRAWEQVDALDNVVQVSFDVAGRPRRVRDQENAVLETKYDEYGRVIARQRPGQGWEHFEYSGRQSFAGEDNLWRVKRYDDEHAARGVHTEWLVDGSGNLLAERHADGNQVHWIRPTGRVTRTEVRNVAGAVYRATTYTYDPVTGLLESSVQGPYALAYDYTPAGRLARTITPDDTLERAYEHGLLAHTLEAGVEHRYLRNPTTAWIVGEQTRVGSGAVRTAEIGRDRLGRITSIQWNDGSGSVEALPGQGFGAYDYYDNAWITTNQWGINSMLTTVEASTFDHLGRLLSRHTSGAGLPGKLTSWTWYRNGALDSVTTPAGHVIKYDYGSTFDYQLDEVRLDGVAIAEITDRDLRGAITGLSLPTLGQMRTTAYDAVGRPATRTTGPVPAVYDFMWSATYNPDGTIANETIEDVAGGDGWVNRYRYDGAGRLIYELAGKTDTSFEYTLDAAGNRTAITVTPPVGPPTVTTLAYAGPKLMHVAATALTYNAWNEVSTDHHGNHYERSADGLVTMITDGSSATAFARNAGGVPVAALEMGGSTRRTTWGLSPEGLPLEVEEGDGTVLTYLDVEGIHIGTAVDGVFAQVDADERGSELRHGAEMLGAATAFGAGTVVPAGSDERFLYAGLERVPAAGEIMLSRLRTYDPTIGRFLEPDRIGSLGGLELYQYSHGDPVNFVDPMGTAELGTNCSGTSNSGIGRPLIEPMVPPTMDSGVPTSPLAEFEAERALRASLRSMAAAWADFNPFDPMQNLPFPNPKGPLCVVNCGSTDNGNVDIDIDADSDINTDTDVDGDGDIDTEEEEKPSEEIVVIGYKLSVWEKLRRMIGNAFSGSGGDPSPVLSTVAPSHFAPEDPENPKKSFLKGILRALRNLFSGSRGDPGLVLSPVAPSHFAPEEGAPEDLGGGRGGPTYRVRPIIPPPSGPMWARFFQFSAGVNDEFSLGFTAFVREDLLGWNYAAPDNGAYSVGSWTGFVGSLAVGGAVEKLSIVIGEELLGSVLFYEQEAHAANKLGGGGGAQSKGIVQAALRNVWPWLLKTPISERTLASRLGAMSGDVIERDIETSQGLIRMEATVEIVGRELHLKDFSIFPYGPDLKIGFREVAALRSQLVNQYREMGFESLRISGERVTGVNPNRPIEYFIDLTKERK